MVVTCLSHYKAGKRNASQDVSMLSSESAIASKIIKSLDDGTKASIPYTYEEVLVRFLFLYSH